VPRAASSLVSRVAVFNPLPADGAVGPAMVWPVCVPLRGLALASSVARVCAPGAACAALARILRGPGATAISPFSCLAAN
jgi:hypothetical protein